MGRRNSLGRQLLGVSSPNNKVSEKIVEQPETSSKKDAPIFTPSQLDHSKSFESVINLIGANLKSPFDRWAKDEKDRRLNADKEHFKQSDVIHSKLLAAPGGGLVDLIEKPEDSVGKSSQKSIVSSEAVTLSCDESFAAKETDDALSYPQTLELPR